MESKSGIMIVMAAAAGLGFIMLNLRRWRMRQNRKPPGTFDDAAARDVRGEMESLLAEIQDLSREQIARLDTKIRMLNQLLLECDQKKNELEALLSKNPQEASEAAPTPPPPPPARPSNPLHDQVYALNDAGKDASQICTATGLEKGEVELILGLRKVPPVGR